MQKNNRKIVLAMAYIGAMLLSSPLQSAVPELDPELISALQAKGSVRVIVTFARQQGRAFDRALPDNQRIQQISEVRDQILRDLAGQAVPRRTFLMVPGFAAEVDRQGLQRLQNHPLVKSIDLDLPGSGNMLEGGALANIPDVYAAGLTGSGAKVAIVDSGIDTDHADFSGRLVGQQCMCSGGTGCCPNGLATQSGNGAAEDDHGHGTNVTGIAAGGGAVALRGAAPAASIVSVKVLDSSNSFCCLSDVIAAFDWVRVNHADTSVLNASLGTFSLFTSSCDAASPAMTSAVDNLVANGTMVFVSSGNQASSTQTASPACIESSISVGALWDAPRDSTSFLGCTDSVVTAMKPTCFTNSNNTVDLFAPGAFISSSGRGGTSSTFGGTSQASPMSAGCAAALRAWRPEATVAEVEAALKASPLEVTDPKNDLKFPALDCQDAKDRLSAAVSGSFADGFEAISE